VRRAQDLSAGMHGFQEACKLEDTPLPFAYSQMVAFTLIIFAASCATWVDLALA
jgi:predicted membrane chloride channel (bestrophin family)